MDQPGGQPHHSASVQVLSLAAFFTLQGSTDTTPIPRLMHAFLPTDSFYSFHKCVGQLALSRQREAEEAANSTPTLSEDSRLLHCLILLRSEEHTSELQSQFHLVCRLLLEKKKKK